MSKKTIIIAGPNGAGKTTFARTFLPVEAQGPKFINADLIAEAISPDAPQDAAIEAGKRMLAAIEAAVAAGESFALETTLAGRNYLRHIRRWRGLGYHVTLFFLRLPDAKTAIARVATRVKQGGHDIPEDVIRRRFDAGLHHLDAYKAVVDAWAVYDNSGEKPILLDWSERP